MHKLKIASVTFNGKALASYYIYSSRLPCPTQLSLLFVNNNKISDIQIS